MSDDTAREISEALNLLVDMDTTTILMVEDNPDHAQLAETALQKQGFWLIDIAGTMAEAFEKMRAKKYRVLLVDYCLPDGYGLDLLDWVDETCTVVMMTAQGSEKVAAEAFKKGALDYVVKDSLFREVLPEIVAQAVAKNQAMLRSANSENGTANGKRARSAVAYRQPLPLLKGYIHTDHLKTNLSKIRRHLAEIKGCVRVVRYNPDEPVTETQRDFLESAADSCELVDQLLAAMLLCIEPEPKE